MPIADPPPNEPNYPTLDDVRAYSLWLDRQVVELGKAVDQFAGEIASMPPAVDLQKVAIFVATANAWGAWRMRWASYAKQKCGVSIVVPLPVPLPAAIGSCDWASVKVFHVELEGWREQFRVLGVKVPDDTPLPGHAAPPLAPLEALGWGLGLLAVVIGAGYAIHKWG